MVYSDLYHRLLVMINNLRSFTSLWREQCLMIKHLTEVIHLFYMPEIHDSLVPLLLEYLVKGNKDIKQASC